MSNTLKIYWKEPKNHRRLHVGNLSYVNDEYVFQYEADYKYLLDKGFLPIIPFFEFTEKYTSKTLFPAFACRLPDPKRKDINYILAKYGLSEYNAFQLLAKSGGRSPSDRLEFIEAIDISDKETLRDFYIAGVTFSEFCQGKKCIEKHCLSGFISLEPEKDNKYDPNAVKIMLNNKRLGYIPVYYSESITNAISLGMNIDCKIIETNFTTDDDKECGSCIKVRLHIQNN